MTRLTPRTTLVAVVVAVSALLGLTACTSSSHNCSAGSCAISLSGAGASVELDARDLLSPGADGEITFELVGASDGIATFIVNRSEGTCETGESVTVAGVAVTCTDVGDDVLSMEVSA